jgi:uncharacterized membrane protein YbhN (UPF0104 family)
MAFNQVLKQKILFLKLSVSIVILAILFFLSDTSKMLNALVNINLWIIFIAVSLCFLQMVLAGFRWYILGVGTGDFLNILTVIKINFAAMFCNQVLPTSIGGDVVRVTLAGREGLTIGRAIRTVLLDRVTGLLSLIVLIAFTFIAVESYLPKEWPVQTIKVSPILILIIVFILFYNGKTLAPLLQKVGYFEWFGTFLREGSVLIREGKTIYYTISISIIIHSIGALCVWTLANDLGLEINYLSVLGFLPFISLAQLIPISIAGWGVREGVVVTLFAWMGMDASIALLVSIIWGSSIAISAVLCGFIWVGMRSADESLKSIKTNEFYDL